jgi:glycosyltransferase involved in cell wall biosynthesis
MRILWLSNPPWAGSGYGEQTGLFVSRCREAGHEVAVACNYGLGGTKLVWDGIPCYPTDNAWGNLALPTYADDFRADAIVALCDSWVLQPDTWPDGLRVACWAPIDHYPTPPQALAVLAHEQIQPVAMSRFGYRLLDEAGLDPLYVPHGIDTAKFRPKPEIRDQVRDELSIPRDVFLVGMVAANKGNAAVPRKGFPQAFHAFAEFSRKHEDAWLYVHSEAKPSRGGGGIALDTLAEAVGAPAGRVRFPFEAAWHLGMPSKVVAALYQAFDALLLPSMGEGFAIPLIEAQASGVPVITSDHSAMTENCGAGWLVSGDPWWDALQESFFIVPSLASIVSALEEAYEHRDDQALRERAVAFAADFDADLVFERYWLPALDRLVARPESNPDTPDSLSEAAA